MSTITKPSPADLIKTLGNMYGEKYGRDNLAMQHLRKVWLLAKADDPRWTDFLRLWQREVPLQAKSAADVILEEFHVAPVTRKGRCPVCERTQSLTGGGSGAGRMVTHPGDPHTVCTGSGMLPDEVREVMSPSELRRAEPKAHVTPTTRITQDGMYRNPVTGEIFKVQFNKGQGDGRRLYAKRMEAWTEDGTSIKSFSEAEGSKVQLDRVCFVYKSGAVLRLTPDMKMTMEQAKTFGALYGTCVRCGRALTREDSIERSMGSTCASKF